MQRSTTVHTDGSLIGRGDIFPHVYPKIARIVYVLDMVIYFVCPCNEVIPHLERWISDNQHLLALAKWRGVTGNDTEPLQFLRRSKMQIGNIDTCTRNCVAQFDLIDIQIAAHKGKYGPSACHIADAFQRFPLGYVQ